MTEVRNLLLDIGASLGRTPEQMQPLITKLEDQWYDSLESLRGIQESQWAALGLPQRLVDEIKKRIGCGQEPMEVDSTPVNGGGRSFFCSSSQCPLM